MKRIKFLLAWYDLWFGAFIDTKKKNIYLMIPMIGIIINYGKPNKDALGWTYVKDTLPKKSNLYLVMLKGCHDVYISYYKKNRNLFEIWGAGRDPYLDMKVIAWQEMPEVPEIKE